MNTRTKSIAILVGTLLLGMVLGGVLVGTISRNREGDRGKLIRPGGFVEHLKGVIEPTSDEQWEQVRPILERVGMEHRGIISDAHKELKASFDSLLVELEAYLEPEQLKRLKEEHARMGRAKHRRPGGRRGRHDHPHGPPPGPPDGLPPADEPPPGGE